MIKLARDSSFHFYPLFQQKTRTLWSRRSGFSVFLFVFEKKEIKTDVGCRIQKTANFNLKLLILHNKTVCQTEERVPF